MNCQLAKSELFNGVKCDFYRNENNEVFMTKQQIGAALEYSDPQDAIDKIHRRNQERLDQFSVEVKLSATDGKLYTTRIYNEKGIYEIIRFSKKSKANQFYDWVYEVLKTMRQGNVGLGDIRQLAKEKRKTFTDKLKEHNVSRGYIGKFNAYGQITVDMKTKLGIDRTKKKDQYDSFELKETAIAEDLASLRLDKFESNGYRDCHDVSCKAAQHIHTFVVEGLPGGVN